MNIFTFQDHEVYVSEGQIVCIMKDGGVISPKEGVELILDIYNLGGDIPEPDSLLDLSPFMTNIAIEVLKNGIDKEKASKIEIHTYKYRSDGSTLYVKTINEETKFIGLDTGESSGVIAINKEFPVSPEEIADIYSNAVNVQAFIDEVEKIADLSLETHRDGFALAGAMLSFADAGLDLSEVKQVHRDPELISDFEKGFNAALVLSGREELFLARKAA